MEKEEAVKIAKNMIREENVTVGNFRDAFFTQDFASGSEINKSPYGSRLFYFPTPFQGKPNSEKVHKKLLSQKEGWVVIFNPASNTPSSPDENILLWVDAIDGSVWFSPSKNA